MDFELYQELLAGLHVGRLGHEAMLKDIKQSPHSEEYLIERIEEIVIAETKLKLWYKSQ